MNVRWNKVSTLPKRTGWYLVGHRGHCERVFYFAPEDKTPKAGKGPLKKRQRFSPNQVKSGWFRLPNINATHWMRIPPID